MVLGHAFSWRASDGGVRTTVVGKISLALGGAGNPFVSAEPIVHFDRIAADRRFVDEVGELMPWTVSASLVIHGGPLQVEIDSGGGMPRTISVKEGAPIGISMASEVRAQLAKKHLSRGEDGLLQVAAGTDPRYFSAAPPWQGLEPPTGAERFVVDRGGQRVTLGPLPGIALVAEVATDGGARCVALGFDLVVLDAIKSRVSYVARAVLIGFADLRRVRMVSHAALGAADRGDPPPSSMRGPRGKDALEGTAEISPLLVARLAMPFAEGPRRPESRPDLPATPFDAGYAPARPAPAMNVGRTVSGPAYPDMMLQAAAIGLQFAVPAAQPGLGVTGQAQGRDASSAPSTEEGMPRVAAPRKGAMAKPRPRKR